MKFWIICGVALIAVLAVSYFASTMLQSGSSPSGRPDSSDIRNLRIN